MPKLIAMLRVKDGDAFIDAWLANVAPLVDEIVVVDNGSTDGTYEKLCAHPSVTCIGQTCGFDEGRDKNLLYRLARSRAPDWLLWLDVDETFESWVTRRRLDRLMNDRSVNRVFFRRFHFTDQDHFNVSLRWLMRTSGYDRVLWREHPSGYFNNVVFNNGLIRGIPGKARISHMRLRHTGYMYANEVEKKVRIYRAVDSSLEATYQSMRFNRPLKMRWRERVDAPVRVFLLDLFLDVVFAFRRAAFVLRGR